MSVRVLFLGPLRDLAGRGESEFVSASGDLDWPELLAVLESQVTPALADAVRDLRVKLAINGAVVADREAVVVRDGDEIALLPPVSGG